MTSTMPPIPSVIAASAETAPPLADTAALIDALDQLQESVDFFKTETQRIEAGLTYFGPFEWSLAPLTSSEPRLLGSAPLWIVEAIASAMPGKGIEEISVFSSFSEEDDHNNSVLDLFRTFFALYPSPGEEWMFDAFRSVRSLYTSQVEKGITLTRSTRQSIQLESHRYSVGLDPAGTLWTTKVEYL